MMGEFWRFEQDMRECAQWVLGSVKRDGVAWHPYLCRPVEGDFVVEVQRSGRPTAWAMAAHGVPVVSGEVAEIVANACQEGVQVVRVRLASGVERYVINCLRVVECIDVKRTRAVLLEANDRRRTDWRRYGSVGEVRVLKESVPSGCELFRVEGWRMALIGSSALRDALLQKGADGLVCIGTE